MRITAKYLLAGAFAFPAAAGFLTLGEVRTVAQGAPPPSQATPQAEPQQPTFRVAVDLVTTDVIVRDSGNNSFVSDLTVDEFEVYEDGVLQEIVSLVLTHGGRVFNIQSPPPAPAQEGIILPPIRPTSDAAGRVFLIFIDDLHLAFGETPRTRDLVKRILRYLVHDGDMFGIVSTGTSSISEQLTYDRQVLEAAVSRITGSGMRPDDILRTATSGQGHPELRFRAHVAFKTAYELMRNLESLRNRRKAVIYISSGYNFNPFAMSRMKYQAEMLGIGADEMDTNPFLRPEQQGQQFAEADLWRELGELTRAANRANATFYTIDPRGLMTSQQDLGNEQVDTAEWLNHIRTTQDSLRILAEETGGIAVVNQNGFDAALKRIDAETSDYYVLGYYSSNPDPLRRTRRLEVKALRDGVEVWSRTSYSLRSPEPVQ